MYSRNWWCDRCTVEAGGVAPNLHRRLSSDRFMRSTMPSPIGWYGVIWYGMVWCGMVWCGMVWCGMVWYGVVWCGMVWCGMVLCGMVWCGVVWCGVVWDFGTWKVYRDLQVCCFQNSALDLLGGSTRVKTSSHRICTIVSAF